MKKLYAVSLMLAAMFMLSACESWDNPSPSDTNAAMGSADRNGNLPDGSYGADAEGLKGRGINSLDGFDPNNINPEDIVCTVYFGFDQYAIPSSERGKLKEAAQFYSANPNVKTVLVGRTDWYGTEEYNLLLSDKRASAVSEYLETNGVNAANMERLPVGEANATPDVDKNSPQAKQDRRVEIVKLTK